MTGKLPDRYIDDAIRLYATGLTTYDVARQLGVSQPWVNNALANRDVPRRGIRKSITAEAVAKLYNSGMSELAMSKKLGIARSGIRRRLLEARLKPRTGSEAQQIRVNLMTPKARKDQARAANAAARGRTATMKERCQRAQTVMHKQLHVSEYERQAAALLAKRGIETIPQFAIGPYNCDLGADPVAVEIFGGQWHWHGRHLLRTPKRFRYILNAGWHILVVRVGRDDPFTGATADYIAAFIKRARSNPSARREYRVIRCAGQVLAAGRANDHKISIIPTLRRRHDIYGSNANLS